MLLVRFSFTLILSGYLANAALLRSHNPSTPQKPAEKVKHLVMDIEESVRKAGEDAEMVFATLYTYDGQLETSLKRELGTLNQTLEKLHTMQSTYSADMNASRAKLAHLGADAEDSKKMASKYEAGTTETRNKFDSLQNNVQMLISLLKNAGITPQGKLVTPEAPDARGEPARVYAAIRRLLGTNEALRSSHQEVFGAFLSAAKTGADGHEEHPVIRMSQPLLRATVETLAAIQSRLHSMKADALLQFDSLHRRFEQEAVFLGANANAQKGLEAENEQKAQELAFSIKFTKSVLELDEKFHASVTDHVKANAELIYAIRDLRQAQLKILRDLAGILSAEGAISSGLSFLETSSQTSHAPASFAGLQAEVETTLRKHGDTHEILMHVKEMLDEDEPVDSQSVRDTIIEMEGALRSVEDDQSKFQEAKRGCESQKFHAVQEEQTLKANLALMSAARDHAQKAIRAAQTNIKGIVNKARALDTSATDFARISSQAIKSLEGQSHDRSTIMLAVKKAAEVVGPSLPAGDSTVNLMNSLLRDLKAQELKDRAYRMQQDRFQSEFSRYVQDYSQLLAERRRHYESSLGVLELHVSELASDLLAQEQTLTTGEDLKKQSQGLCDSVLAFYDKHTKHRAELSTALRSILPNLPTVLSDGAIASGN
mmetsp:Transcript_51576/g.81890  ORF Transcript_51576/g.81890 Transcript_51576/m.81890 type:complete len:657 (+) Transcript_51576:86-2056(+)|eukprot:CAMPEP_0169083886 /NCGR_PEP_ID=MMETSP1015-20121227/12318_1 /TAXON_ID=342587 /ORGANISM="Karlodinium micrum, Strain CCMP2283" /LENGTH=656 /DNA_ID=CAMNT_0009143841 /DNA_START=81 /DNA_END=2051 /DNA_ORIENTATION=+